MMTEDEFEAKYEPQQKPDGNYFEWEDIKHLTAHNVWTVVDYDDGKLYALPGFHIVGKVGYITSETPWLDATQDAVWAQPPDEED